MVLSYCERERLLSTAKNLAQSLSGLDRYEFLTTLETVLKSTDDLTDVAEKCAELQETNIELEKRMEDLETKIEIVENNLTEVTEKCEELQETNTKLETRLEKSITEIDAKLAELDASTSGNCRMEKLESMFASITAALEVIEERFQKLNTKLDALEDTKLDTLEEDFIAHK